MSASNFPALQSTDVNKSTSEESDVFSSFGLMHRACITKSYHRRASLDVDCPIKASVYFDRRSSIGTLRSLNLSRRFSLGEESLKLRPAGSSSSINGAQLRRRSLDTCSGVYDPRRRSSLGAESLIEYDLEEENESSPDPRPDLPSDALLGLQYADDVFAVKRDLEVKYHPRKCLDSQPQVTEPVRCAIVNWLVKINRKLNFGAETVFLAVHLLDRFLASSAIASDCVQLLGVCSLFVAAKMEEIKVPGMSALARLCSTPYQKHHFRRMEILLLTKLGFYLHAPTSWYFINHLALKACQLGYLDRRVTRAARKVAELCLCQYNISQYLPSVQAAASFLSAVSVLEPELGQTLTRLLDDKNFGDARRIISEADFPGATCFCAYECEACFSNGNFIASGIAQSQGEARDPVDAELPGETKKEEGIMANLEIGDKFEEQNEIETEEGEREEEVGEGLLEQGACRTDSTLVSALVLAIKCLYSSLEQEEASCCWKMMTDHLLPYEDVLKVEFKNYDPSASSTTDLHTKANGTEFSMPPCTDAAAVGSSAKEMELCSVAHGHCQLLGLASATQTEVGSLKEPRCSSLDRRDSGVVGMERELQQSLNSSQKSPRDMEGFLGP